MVTLAQQNVRSYSNKFYDIFKIISDKKIDILCMTETWLNDGISICIPKDYTITRTDRNGHGGGVAILYRNSFKVSHVKIDSDRFKSPHSLEFVCKGFQIDYNKKFIVCVIYRTQLKKNVTRACYNDIINIERLLIQLQSHKTLVYVLGDFNFNLLDSNDRFVKKFSTMYTSLSLRQIIQVSTRQNSLLDLILTNNNNNLEVGVIDTDISDHYMTLLKLPIKKNKGEYSIVQYRNYMGIDIENLNTTVADTTFISDVNAVDEYLSLLVKNVTSVFDILAPIKRKKVKQAELNMPISEGLKQLKKESLFHYNKWKSTKIKFHFDKHNELKKMMKKTALEDNRKAVANNIASRGVWDTMSGVFGLKFKGEGSCNYDDLVADELNAYYATIPFPTGIVPYDTLKQSTPTTTTEDCFQVTEISKEDLRQCWRSMKKKNSCFMDSTGMCKKMFNVLFKFPNFTDALLDFCNLSFSTGLIPNKLKMVRIVPIPKCLDAKVNSQFRPIGISPFLMLLLERIYIKKLSTYAEKTSILSKYQFGCRTAHSTEHAMLAVLDTIKKKVDEGLICAIVSLDLRNAFPSVHRERLLQKIRDKYKISDHWLRNYFSDRKQCVDVQGNCSNCIDSWIGLVQGSVIGPTFFTFFINDIVDVINVDLTLPEMYVDDTNLVFYDELENSQEMVEYMNTQMVKVCSWVQDNHLMLNSDKTKLLFISNKRNIAHLSNLSIIVNDAIIESCNSLKCLGLTLDCNLNFENHIYKLVKNCYFRIHSLYKIKKYVPVKYRIMIVNALIMSLLYYMCSIWGVTTKRNLGLIERVIRTAARFVTGIWKYDRIAPAICNELKWLMPEEMCMLKTLCTFFKIRNGLPIVFFSHYYRLNGEVRPYCTKSSNDIYHSYMPNGPYGYSTFHFRSITMWNALPTNIKEIGNFDRFKRLLKVYLLEKQKEKYDC